jgi:hypothetical protein
MGGFQISKFCMQDIKLAQKIVPHISYVASNIPYVARKKTTETKIKIVPETPETVQVIQLYIKCN